MAAYEMQYHKEIFVMDRIQKFIQVAKTKDQDMASKKVLEHVNNIEV